MENGQNEVNRGRPAHNSRCPLVCSGRAGTSPETHSGADRRDPAGLPVRLSDLLLQRADWRLGGAGLPPAECAERLRAMPAGARRGQRLGAGGPEPEARAGSGCTRIESAGICLPRPSAADVAATGGDAATPLLRPGLSRLLRRRPAWWRPDHRVLASEWPLAVEAMPLGVDVSAAGSLERQISPGFSKGCGR
jgi:hypothetical protein